MSCPRGKLRGTEDRAVRADAGVVFAGFIGESYRAGPAHADAAGHVFFQAGPAVDFFLERIDNDRSDHALGTATKYCVRRIEGANEVGYVTVVAGASVVRGGLHLDAQRLQFLDAEESRSRSCADESHGPVNPGGEAVHDGGKRSDAHAACDQIEPALWLRKTVAERADYIQGLAFFFLGEEACSPAVKLVEKIYASRIGTAAMKAQWAAQERVHGVGHPHVKKLTRRGLLVEIFGSEPDDEGIFTGVLVGYYRNALLPENGVRLPLYSMQEW